MKHIIKSVVSAGALLAVLNFGVPSAQADQQLSVKFNQPVHASVNIDETGCLNHPGPNITISGDVAIGGVGVRLILQNNTKGTHTAETNIVFDVNLIPVGSKITIPKQPVLGGVGGNPHIWLQFYNKGGNLSDEIYLGRCVQGLKIGHDSLNDTLVALLISAMGCNNHPGPFITFGGGMNLSGLNARLIFRNNLKGTHTAQAETAVTIIPDGTIVSIPKQPSQGGAGGNPLVYVQVLHGNGDAVGDPIFLGRCNKL